MCAAIPYFDWPPPNSAELNPINNLWSIMKRKVQEEVDTSSLAKLKAALLKLWEEEQLPKELLENLATTSYTQERECNQVLGGYR